MSTNKVGAFYAKALVWCALFFGLVFGTSNIVNLIFVDFIHGNPHRTQEHALTLMVIFTPILFLLAFLGTFVIFGLSQIFQAKAVQVIIAIFGDQYKNAVIVLLPITAAVTWYCYDYLTPTDCNLGINTGPDWTPYQHGLTVQRYLKTLALQAPVTIFTYLYVNYSHRRSNSILLLASFFILSVISGTVHGYYTAKKQYQFIENTRLAPTGLWLLSVVDTRAAT